MNFSAHRARIAQGALWLFAAVATPLPAPAQTSSPATATPPSEAAIRSLLAELDAAFARGDVEACLAAFAPDHQGAQALLRQQLERWLQATSSRTRTSKLATTPRRIGARTVVRVRQDFRLQGLGARAATTAFTEDCFYCFADTTDGKAVPTLLVDVAPDNGCVRGDRFRCPACNYEIGGADGWLCVPLRSERANALEAARFWLLGSEVTLDISVQVDPDATPAMRVVEELTATMHRLEPRAQIAAVQPWVPPGHRHRPPTGLRGATSDVALPDDERARCYVTTFGGLQHLLLLRGTAANQDKHAAAIDALLASYRLLEECDFQVAMQRPLEHHTGGAVSGSTYRNQHFGLHLVGEPNWKPAMRSGGAAFRVVWTSPAGSRLWLTGHRVPVGMDHWDDDSADRWLLQLLAHNDLVPAAPLEAAGWSALPAFGGRQRDVVASRHKGDAPLANTAPKRVFRLVRRDDLLLVLDGLPATPEDEAAVHRMFAAIAPH